MITDNGSLVFSIGTAAGNPRTISYVNSNFNPCVVRDLWTGRCFEDAYPSTKIAMVDLEEIEQLFREGVNIVGIYERECIVFANIHRVGHDAEKIIEGFGVIPRSIIEMCLTMKTPETTVEFDNYIANLGISYESSTRK